ncbi:MAG: hypothetical protein ACI4SG_05415 [Oligosphaeraceae bacterium]
MEVTEAQRNQFIQQCLEEGMSLSQVQDQLAQNFAIHMTYMELRMLTAELQVSWEKQDARAMAARGAKPAPQTPPPPRESPEEWEETPDASREEQELPPEEPDAPPPQETVPPASQDGALRGATTVEVSKVVRPGASLSGTVKFGSGASGEWYVDAYGRLGLNLDEGSAKPDQQDVQEFQVELQKALGY